MSRRLPYALGLLGLGAITFPFLWLRLAPDFTRDTVRTVWAPEHGLEFFEDLSPILLIGFLVWLFLFAKRRLGVDGTVARHPWTKWFEEKWARGGAATTLAVVLALGFFLSPSSLGLLTSVGIYMLLALGLNITVGMTGLLVLGYAGFFGFGAYFFALAQQALPFFPWWLALPLAFVVGGGAGYLLGLPCLRLRGDYLAIVTLGFAEAFRELMRNLDVAGADKGIILNGQMIFRGWPHLVTRGEVAYWIMALLLGLAVFLVQRLYRSPIGQAWMAIRENEVAAESLGVPVVQMKLLAFSLSAAIAAVAGVIYGAKDGFVSPAICEFQQSIMILAMVILGGLGNSYGALLGAALLYLVPEYMKFLPSIIQENGTLSATVPPFVLTSLQNLSDYRLLLFGAVMVLMMLYRPQGLLGTRRRKTEMRNP